MVPMTIDLMAATESELLAFHGSVLTELKRRGVVRTGNNPTGDYTEWLVAKTLALSLATSSAKGFDATDADGVKYQIKGRRITSQNPSTQLGVIRSLESSDFDVLIAIIFDESWNVLHAVKISHETVSKIATFRKHTNGHVMHIRRQELAQPGVEVITHRFRAALTQVNSDNKFHRSVGEKKLNAVARTDQRT